MDPFDFDAFLAAQVPGDLQSLDPLALLYPAPFLAAPPAPTLPESGASFASTSSTPFPTWPASQDAVTAGLESGEKLKSCAACRMRRVKCEREPGTKDCIKCLAKGLVCTQLPPTVRKKPNRTGKRIESARALFGEAAPASTADIDGEAISKPSKRPRKASPTEGALELQPTSLVGKLVTGELEASLTGSLLELYSTMSANVQIPLFDCTNFRLVFEQSGRRLDQLPPNLEVLGAVVLALAARVSDHPLLVGANAPSPSELLVAAKEGYDLSEWGRRRVDACEVLATRALKLVDERGLWRTASVENLATILALEGAIGKEVRQEAGLNFAGRPLGNAYTSHLRTLIAAGLSKTDRDRLMESGIGWIAFCRDAVLSAVAGEASTFSDDDVFLLYGGEAPSLEKAMSLPAVDPAAVSTDSLHEFFWTLYGALLAALASVARQAAVKLTGIRATRNPRLDEAFVQHYVSTLRLAGEACDKLDRAFLRSQGPPGGTTAIGLSAYDSVRSLRFMRCSLVFILLRVVRQRARPLDADDDSFDSDGTERQIARILQIHEWPDVPGPRRTPETDDYWQWFAKIRQEVEEIAFAAAREMAAILASILKTGLPLGALTGARMFFVRLASWASVLVDAPTAEEGGSPSFTFEQKIADLQVILRATNAVGWSFPQYTRAAPWLSQMILDAQIRMQAHRASTPSCDLSFLASLSDVSTPSAFFDDPSLPATSSAAAPSSPWSLSNSHFDFLSQPTDATDGPVLSDAELSAMLELIGQGSGESTARDLPAEGSVHDIPTTEPEDDVDVVTRLLVNILT
ncbi:hypothetical protein JCM1840_002524 [Sporobolomyces johnsonii]